MDWRSKLRWKVFKPWLAVVGSCGAGLLPCPECGGPILVHIWPVTLALTLRNVVHGRRRRDGHREVEGSDEQVGI